MKDYHKSLCLYLFHKYTHLLSLLEGFDTLIWLKLYGTLDTILKLFFYPPIGFIYWLKFYTYISLSKLFKLFFIAPIRVISNYVPTSCSFYSCISYLPLISPSYCYLLKYDIGSHLTFLCLVVIILDIHYVFFCLSIYHLYFILFCLLFDAHYYLINQI